MQYDKIADPEAVGLEGAVRAALDRLADMSPDGFCMKLHPEIVSCDPDALRLTFAYEIEPWQLNPNGIVHGGVLSAMLDTNMGYLVVALTRIPTATISQTTNFLRPAPPGKRLIAEASLDKRGRHIVFVSSKMWQEGDEKKLIATSEATYTAS
ncbi:MAG: PaaI family thioesterase [Oscillospiraceae bacterium]|nr:PaaI family thioesterase [Oscillospiraceae bacterium]